MALPSVCLAVHHRAYFAQKLPLAFRKVAQQVVRDIHGPQPPRESNLVHTHPHPPLAATFQCG